MQLPVLMQRVTSTTGCSVAGSSSPQFLRLGLGLLGHPLLPPRAQDERRHDPADEHHGDAVEEHRLVHQNRTSKLVKTVVLVMLWPTRSVTCRIPLMRSPNGFQSRKSMPCVCMVYAGCVTE
jgi:hypothetical protein